MGQQAVVTSQVCPDLPTAQQVDPVTSPSQSCLAHALRGKWVQSRMVEPKSSAPVLQTC